MGHDEHFLQRLDRFTDAHVALALSLYREPELVRAVLAQGRVGDAAERVVIQLDARPLGERVIVAQGGAFVTCLGEGMAGGPWPVVSRASVDLVLARRERTARQLSELNKHTAADWVATLKRLQTAGHRLSREELCAAQPMVGLLPLRFLSFVMTAGLAYEKAYVPLSHVRFGDDAAPGALRHAWNAAWYTMHLTALLGCSARQLKAALELVKPDPSLLTAMLGGLSMATSVGTLAGAARSVNAVARLSRELLPECKRALEPGRDFSSSITAMGAVQALAMGGSKYAAEAGKALRPPVLAEEPPTGTLSRYYRALRVAAAAIVDEDAAARDRRTNGDARRYAHALLARGPRGKDFPDASQVPGELIDPVLGNCLQSTLNTGGLKWLFSLAERWTITEPEQFYFPAEHLELLLPKRFDGQWSWDLVAKREELWSPRKPTVRKEQGPGRNDPCRCGSGKKFKKCCG